MINSVDRRKIIRHNTQSSLVGENRETIPNDLIIEILSRLPAKPIARFRCLSNQWASFLRSSYFTESFLIHSSTRPRVLFRLELKGKWHFFTAPQPRNLDKDITLVSDYHLGISGYSPQENCLSVNGFIYLLDLREVMGKFERVPVICNPSTGQHLTLPKVRARNIDLRSFFGYDPINKQFKVLCMTVANYRHQINSKEHQVLTIGKGKPSWRKIECVFPHYPDHKRDGICIDGVLYYIARSKMTSMIACFDVRSEKFSFIETEDGSNLYYVSSLVNYKGKLGALTYVYGNHCVLWVLDDTEKLKWSKHTFVLPNTDFHVIKSIWATDTGEFAFVLRHWTNPFYVFYYNLERKSVRRVEIKGIDEKVLMGYTYLLTHFTVTDHVENVMFL